MRSIGPAPTPTTTPPAPPQVLHIAMNERTAASRTALTQRSKLLHKLQAAQKGQERRERTHIEHGREMWQDQLVKLIEQEQARREDLRRQQAQQERQVARLWVKLQRRLTHQRAPWAPPQAELEASSFWKLDKWENSQRQRCRRRAHIFGHAHMHLLTSTCPHARVP